MFDINKLIRPNIIKLQPYSSARSEFKGQTGIFLDANENPYGSVIQGKFNRYPDPLQNEVKIKLSRIKALAPENIFLGNGSDEAIDLVIRIFCNPGKDNIIIMPPTYGMYEVAANINDVQVKKVNLTENFQINTELLWQQIDSNTKIIFICSPNNPTGNSIKREDIVQICEKFQGIVVLDEAYIDFSEQKSFIAELAAYPNLVILQTFSKAWGMANLRIGVAYASKDIIAIFNKVKPPYNVNGQTQKLALQALDKYAELGKIVSNIIAERTKLIENLKQFKFVNKIYNSDANFVLVKVDDAKKLYNYLVNQAIIVRDRSKIELCENSLRITIGTKKENQKLLLSLSKYSN